MRSGWVIRDPNLSAAVILENMVPIDCEGELRHGGQDISLRIEGTVEDVDAAEACLHDDIAFVRVLAGGATRVTGEINEAIAIIINAIAA